MNNRTQIGHFRRSDLALDRFKPLSLLNLRQFWPIYRHRVKVRAVIRYHCIRFSFLEARTMSVVLGWLFVGGMATWFAGDILAAIVERSRW